MINFSDYTSSNATNSVTWVSSQNVNASNQINAGNATSSNSTNIEWKWKLCRECKHGHGDVGCFELTGNFAISIVFNCPCKEYVPSDNLEYLEYRYDKKLGENK